MYRLLTFLFLLACWVVLSGKFDGTHLIMGLVCAGIVTWISSDLYFEDRKKGLGVRLKETGRALVYIGWLLGQIVQANVYILKLVFAPGGMEQVSPRIVRFRTHLKSEFARYLLAQSITLTPGTVTIKIEGDEFHVHAISKEAADGLDGRMERWIAHVYEDGPLLLEKEGVES